MPAQYMNIILPEMREFLEPKGFRIVNIRDVQEVVFSKGIKHYQYKDELVFIALRIFTGISISLGTSRPSGSDAIRVSLWAKHGREGAPFMLQGQKRVHRVLGWQANLQDRLNNWEELLGEACPNCKCPMLIKFNRVTNDGFWGCINYKLGCRGTRKLECSHENAGRKHVCPDCGINLKEKRSPRI